MPDTQPPFINPFQYTSTGNPFLDAILRSDKSTQAIQFANQNVAAPIANTTTHALGAYTVSPVAPPPIQAVAGGGTPGQMEGAMAQSYLPGLHRTMAYLHDIGTRGYRGFEGPQRYDPQIGDDWFDALKWVLKRDLADLPAQNLGPAAHNLGAGLYDRFFFPAVLQQMQQDPYFAPIIQQLTGGSGGTPT